MLCFIMLVPTSTAAPHHHVHHGFVDPVRIMHEAASNPSDMRRRIASLLAAASSAVAATAVTAAASPNATRISPAAYGADPSGRVASSAAFDAAVAAMLSLVRA